MPTFQLYANGEKIDELVGANEDNLRKLIELNIKSNFPSVLSTNPPAARIKGNFFKNISHSLSIFLWYK